MVHLFAAPARMIVALLALCWLIPPPIATATEAGSLELEEPGPLPQAVLLTMDGEETGLDAHQGEIVVVNFWATWCAPCKQEMPSLARLQAEFDKDAFRVIAIAVDRAGPEKIERFMAEAQASALTVYRDPKMATMKDFGLRGLPTTLLVDREGRIIARHAGFAEWDAPDIMDTIRKLLDETS